MSSQATLSTGGVIASYASYHTYARGKKGQATNSIQIEFELILKPSGGKPRFTIIIGRYK